MSRYQTLSLFLVLAALWGAAFVAISAGLSHLPPILFAALRYDIAGLLMLGYAAAVADWRPRDRAGWWQVLVGAGLLIAAYHAFLFVGQLHTTAAAAAIVVSLSPVLSTGFARALVPTDALSPVGLVGVVVGLVGVAIVVRPDPGSLLAADAVAKGLVFCAALAFALGSVLTRRIDADLAIETMEAWSMLGGAAMLHLVSLALGEPIVPADWIHPEAIGALAYLSVGASAVGFLIYFELLERLGAVEINMVSYVAPIVAAVVGWLYLGEVVDDAALVGFGVIVVGFLLVKRRAIRRELGQVRSREASE
ncbi:DMT family transporter [Natrinema thermotolerans]